MMPPPYILSFTVGGLFLFEGIELARLRTTCVSWDEVRRTAPDGVFVATQQQSVWYAKTDLQNRRDNGGECRAFRRLSSARIADSDVLKKKRYFACVLVCDLQPRGLL
jgi:hypothetical protein